MIFLALSLLFATSYSMASEENNSGQIVPSLDAMNKDIKLSLVECSCQSQHNLSSSFRDLPQELQLHILNCISIPQIWFEKQRFNHHSGVLSARFNKDETHILTASNDNTARLWDSSSGAEIQRFLHNNCVYSAHFNKDETHILTASNDNTARLWDSSSGDEIQRFNHNNCVNSACFNKDETCILTASDDNSAHLWDVSSGTEIQRFLHDSWVFSACFNYDEKHILTASGDKTARVWDVSSGTEIQRFNHDRCVNSACFNNNGTYVLTASDDIARMWDSSSGAEIQRFNHNGCVSSVCFNKNETYVLTASRDKTARLWQKYTSWTLDQRLLCKLLFTWLLVQKTHKSVNSIYDFIATTCIYAEIDSGHVDIVWKSFPEQIQAAIWQKIKLSIDKYGKIESSLQKLEQKTEPTTSLEYSLLSSQKTLFFGGIMILMCAFATNRFH